MRITLSLALAALVLPLAACSCASEPLPSSPVPAILSDQEAMSLAHRSLMDRGTAPGVFVSAEPLCDGYLLGYRTDFDMSRQPPAESHLLVVKNSGVVDEPTFSAHR
jgi:hypothetical protein